MTIIYTVICRANDASILVEVCDRDVKGTFGTIMIELLQHLRDHPNIYIQENECKTFIQRNNTTELDFFTHFLDACNSAAWGGSNNNNNNNNNDDDDNEITDNNNNNNDTDNHFFHLYFKKGIYYCCLSDNADTNDQKVNFTFLMSIEQEFTKMFRTGRINTANAYSLTTNFSPTMRTSMHYHNIHAKELRQDVKVKALLIRTENIRTVMGRNLNMILERGEKFNSLLSKSETLTKDAQVFKKKSKQAKHMMQRRYYFWYAICAFILAVFLYMTVVSTCGIRLEYCRATTHSSSSTTNGENNNNNDNSNNNNSGDGNGESNAEAGGGN